MIPSVRRPTFTPITPRATPHTYPSFGSKKSICPRSKCRSYHNIFFKTWNTIILKPYFQVSLRLFFHEISPQKLLYLKSSRFFTNSLIIQSGVDAPAGGTAWRLGRAVSSPQRPFSSQDALASHGQGSVFSAQGSAGCGPPAGSARAARGLGNPWPNRRL